MDELINKQEVVDLLMERASSLRGIPGDLGGACSGAAKLIMQMPPAEPRWIPCSERLPKEEGFYLVTLGYKHGAETNIRYFKIENGKRYWSLWGNENITAWMPKPEPYKGVTE